jgi:hypothetical protein
MSNTKLWVALIAVAIIAVGGYMFPKAVGGLFGGANNYDELDATAIKIGGTNGSRVGPIITGTGILIAPSFVSLAASTSLAADIAVTGVVTGDIVFTQFATSSPNGAGWEIMQSSASTTAGFITIRFVNNTGTTATIPASIASTTQYMVLHPRTSVPGL